NDETTFWSGASFQKIVNFGLKHIVDTRASFCSNFSGVDACRL
ncbi:hypothetical protein L915_01722, partial [Phytophthora nicotianae]